MRAHYVVAGLAAPAVWLAAVLLAPVAGADPVSTAPDCTSVAGGTYTGTGTTECQTPGDVEIHATAPEPEYQYPWGDEFFGPGLFLGDGG